MNYTYIHNHSPVLDWTVRSGLTISRTGPDCGPKEPDRTVRSFYQSPFSSLRPDRFSQTGPYFSVRTAVPVLRTVRSGLLERSPKMATVRTGPDRGQSSLEFTIFIMINLEGCLSQVAGVRPAIYPTYRIAMPPCIASALPP